LQEKHGKGRQPKISPANVAATTLPGVWKGGTNGFQPIGADLFGANLRDASLLYANLSGASLSAADLFGVNLSGANLTAARLFYVNLGAANLNGTNFTEVDLMWAIFASVDLTSVVGLETCTHRGQSVIDHRTLEKSGPLPLEFLRGVGLPDTLIKSLPSLFGKTKYYSCFISYSVKDDEFARRIYDDLQSNGVRCWFAPHDLPIGKEILGGIDEGIRLRDKVLLVLSEHSIRSVWVKRK
jgi:hypothetical protein